MMKYLAMALFGMMMASGAHRISSIERHRLNAKHPWINICS